MANDWQVLSIGVLTIHRPREKDSALGTRDENGIYMQRLILPEAKNTTAECDFEAAKKTSPRRSYRPPLKRTVLGFPAGVRRCRQGARREKRNQDARAKRLFQPCHHKKGSAVNAEGKRGECHRIHRTAVPMPVYPIGSAWESPVKWPPPCLRREPGVGDARKVQSSQFPARPGNCCWARG